MPAPDFFKQKFLSKYCEKNIASLTKAFKGLLTRDHLTWAANSLIYFFEQKILQNAARKMGASNDPNDKKCNNHKLLKGSSINDVIYLKRL